MQEVQDSLVLKVVYCDIVVDFEFRGWVYGGVDVSLSTHPSTSPCSSALWKICVGVEVFWKLNEKYIFKLYLALLITSRSTLYSAQRADGCCEAQ